MSGFTHERAEKHDTRLVALVETLAARGFKPRFRDVDDGPDVEIRDCCGERAFVDLKTAGAEQANYSIKIGALRTFWRFHLIEGAVYIVWGDGFVDTPETLCARIIGGPRRATANGSNTDWLLIAKGATPFNDYFTA